MNDVPSTERMLISYLHTHHLLSGPVDSETDLIESGQLDSLVVMDLVSFVASTYGIQMSPREISPENLRSVQRLARFVAARSRVAGEAA